MKKNVCPLCGKPLKKGSTACSCGYKESLAEQGLLRRLAVWSRVQTLGTVLLVLGFLVGAVVWWRSGDIRWGLLALFAFLFSGAGCIFWGQSRQRKLVWEQMGDYFRMETENAFGPPLNVPGLVIDEAHIRRGDMIPQPWEKCQVKNYRQGVHQGVRFGAANVELTHNFEEHVGRDVSDSMSRSVRQFGGVWLVCETAHCAPAGGYLYRREDAAYDRDGLGLLPVLETLGRPAAVRWEENRLELALESTLPVMDLPEGNLAVRDLNGLRYAYRLSLRYLQGIIEALCRCEALFGAEGEEQAHG